MYQIEFKTVIRMLKELSGDLNGIKKIQLETKDILIEIRIIYRETTVEWMKEAKNNRDSKKKKRIQKNEESISSLWDNFKHSNICIIEVPEGEEKEQEIGNLFEIIMKENFPNLVKDIDLQVQEAQRVPNKMDAKRPTPRHIIIKMPKVKDKERILKAAREKQLVTYRGVPIRMSDNFLKEIL